MYGLAITDRFPNRGVSILTRRGRRVQHPHRPVRGRRDGVSILTRRGRRVQRWFRTRRGGGCNTVSVSILTRRGRRVQLRAWTHYLRAFQSSPAADGGCNPRHGAHHAAEREAHRVSILTRRGRRVQPARRVRCVSILTRRGRRVQPSAAIPSCNAPRRARSLQVSILTRRGRRVQPSSLAACAIARMFQSSPAADGGCNRCLPGQAFDRPGAAQAYRFNPHPPRTAGATLFLLRCLRCSGFNPHPPRTAGATVTTTFNARFCSRFQSSPAADGGCNGGYYNPPPRRWNSRLFRGHDF